MTRARTPHPRWLLAVVACVLLGSVPNAGSAAVAAPVGGRSRDVRMPQAASPTAEPDAKLAAGPVVWPRVGAAAYVLGAGRIVVGPHQRVASIASVAKVMTAYLVLRGHPLRRGRVGFRMVVHRRDVADTARRVAGNQSVVALRRGEVLTERQALAALLLPSANNVAIMLARRTAGSVPRFVRGMNRTARRLGLRRTRYTDPSGFAATTRSTARDQAVLAVIAMRDPGFAAFVGRRRYRIPVAGVVHNTDALLRHDGFVGIKTGSDSAAGGCFVFRSRRVVDGRVVNLTGAVLGQRGADLVTAGLAATRRLVDRVAPRAAP